MVKAEGEGPPQLNGVPAVRYLWALPNTLLGLLFLTAAVGRGGRIRIVDGVVEAHGPLLATALRRCVPIPGGAAAITFGHIVLGCDSFSLAITRAHERVHVRQCETWGPLFIPAYLAAALWAWVTGAGAYEGNYFEREASRMADYAGPGAGGTVMMEYLKALAARVRERWLNAPPPPLEDPPLTGVREPRPRRPDGRSAAVAIDEPRESPVVQARGDIGRPPAR